MEIYLIRHTTPDILKGICYGFSDISLPENWQTEAKIVAQNLPKNVDAVFSSPLQRCQILANFVFGNQKIVLDNRLRELNFGDWEMQYWDKIPAEELNNWMTNYVEVVCPNGESYANLAARASNFLENLTQQNYKRVAVFSHGGWIRAALANLRSESLENMMSQKVDYGSITTFLI